MLDGLAEPLPLSGTEAVKLAVLLPLATALPLALAVPVAEAAIPAALMLTTPRLMFLVPEFSAKES